MILNQGHLALIRWVSEGRVRGRSRHITLNGIEGASDGLIPPFLALFP